VEATLAERVLVRTVKKKSALEALSSVAARTGCACPTPSSKFSVRKRPEAGL
jgi:hypothetical protein